MGDPGPGDRGHRRARRCRCSSRSCCGCAATRDGFVPAEVVRDQAVVRAGVAGAGMPVVYFAGLVAVPLQLAAAGLGPVRERAAPAARRAAGRAGVVQLRARSSPASAGAAPRCSGWRCRPRARWSPRASGCRRGWPGVGLRRHEHRLRPGPALAGRRRSPRRCPTGCGARRSGCSP